MVLVTLTGSFFISLKLHAQVTDSDFSNVYKSILQRKSRFQWADLDEKSRKQDSTVIEETQLLLEDLYVFMDEEHRLNGNGRFAFNGNETNNNNLFRIEAGISMDKGIYPYELDFSTSLQTQLKDGSFQENVSDLDISFDFHPIVPDPQRRIKKYEAKIEELEKERNNPNIYQDEITRLIQKYQKKIDAPSSSNGLWLENYVIAKRSSDDYLGIDHHYEIGGGIIFSLFSRAMTRKGITNREEMNRKPSYEIHGSDLVRCLQSCEPVRNALQLSEEELDIITKTRTRFLTSNRKQYSKLRLTLLCGAFYELEKATINKTAAYDLIDSTFKVNLEPTNVFRWLVRPGLVWKPKDKYKFKFYTYWILPFNNLYLESFDGFQNRRSLDYFLDLQSSLEIKIEDHFNIGIYYKMLYDNTPNSIVVTQSNGLPLLLESEKMRSSYGISFGFEF